MDGRIAHSPKLAVALDFSTVDDAIGLVKKIGDLVNIFKIGSELLFDNYLYLLDYLREREYDVFLDFKFHDIERTVHATVANAARLGVKYLTVHSDPISLKGAIEAASGSNTKVLAVTVLTGTSNESRILNNISLIEEVKIRAATSMRMGCDGVVCSGNEIALVRREIDRCGCKGLVFVPGIRPLGTDWHDQKRVVSPSAAIAEGADVLVVGRPIRFAENARLATIQILDEINTATNLRSILPSSIVA